MRRDIPSDVKFCQVKREGDKWFIVFIVTMRKNAKRAVMRCKRKEVVGQGLNLQHKAQAVYAIAITLSRLLLIAMRRRQLTLNILRKTSRY
ncbi:MAG: hypothetical protein A6F72_07050 [Cycloclasticus sp. symbiont of Poecilosclerida sp. N]|nr:MAG: hypothetical protein A6F72_07050 [Cycloclasticus sp. symbiont of Poecilosclerida sp. N]